MTGTELKQTLKQANVRQHELAAELGNCQRTIEHWCAHGMPRKGGAKAKERAVRDAVRRLARRGGA